MEPGGSNGEEGRRAAIRRYVILALLMGLLSGGLITCAIIAVTKYPEPREEGEFGPPYYIGGLLVGSLGLLHALTCIRIAVKGANFPDSDIRKRELACAMLGQMILSMLLVLGCFTSFALAGIGEMFKPSSNADLSGFGEINKPSFTADRSKYNERAVNTLTIIFIAGSVAVLLLDVFGMCIVCTYGGYFGVQIKNRRGRRTVVVVKSQMGGAADAESLQEQNRLLQEQVRLQQQLLNQQQQQQAGQFGYGMPPPASGFAPPAPDAPPPSYDEVKP